MSLRAALSVSAFGVTLLPMIASAAGLTDVLVLASSILNACIGLLITGAIVVFFYSIAMYMLTADNVKKGESLKLALYGVVTIFVMVSIWGIIRLLQSTFKVTSTDPIIPRGVVITPVSY